MERLLTRHIKIRRIPVIKSIICVYCCCFVFYFLPKLPEMSHRENVEYTAIAVIYAGATA